MLPIFEQSQNLVFTEFYDVRQETTPKAGWLPMYSLTAFVYVATAIAFGLLFANEASKSITETVIVSYDDTGHNGYTCQMISKVTASYQIDSTSDPTLTFALVNVIESKVQYEKDYTTADPCNKPLVFIPGKEVDQGVVEYGGALLYGSELAIYTSGAAEFAVQLIYYNYTAGYKSFYQPDFAALRESVAVDVDGNTIMLGSTEEGVYFVYRVVQDVFLYILPGERLYTVSLPNAPTVLNDNAYNIYLVENNTISALNVYTGGNATNTTLFTLPAEEYIEYAAVYHSGSGIKVFYINNSDCLCAWEDGFFTFLGYVEDASGLAVDGNGNYYYLTTTPTGLYTAITASNQRPVSSIQGSTVPASFAVTADSARAVVIFPGGDATESDAMYFVYDLWEESIANAQPVLLTQGFAEGYFTCRDLALNASQLAGLEAKELPTFCPENGVVGLIGFENLYLFSTRDADTYARSRSSGYCPTLYAPIGATIAELPPYSCSRVIRRTFLECLSSSFANTQLLMQILVFLSAMTLSKLSKRFPPQNHFKRNGGNEVEMTSVARKTGEYDVENPMPERT